MHDDTFKYLLCGASGFCIKFNKKMEQRVPDHASTDYDGICVNAQPYAMKLITMSNTLWDGNSDLSFSNEI